MNFYWPEFINDLNDEVSPGNIVFDAGAGDCHWEKRLQKDVNYISMDLGVGDDTMDYSGLTFKGDLSSIPLENSSVDVIICIQVLEHLPEPWIVIDEFFRILKPGGYVYASCPQGEPQHQIPYDYFRYTIFGLESIFRKSGFEIIWLKPQKGNFSKMANDMRHSSEILLKNSNWFRGFFLKIMARLFEYFFKKEDLVYQSNTVGHFIKIRKPISS